jgi:purine-binding chemotaxis protein CheW
MTDKTHGVDGQDYLLVTFQVVESFFGLETSCVQEVILVSAITHVYHAPEDVRGIINLRGKIVTIIDLEKKLYGEDSQINEDSRILITPLKDEYVGILVTRIGEVVDLVPDQIEPNPPNVSEKIKQYIDGIYRSKECVIAILNLENLLA